MPVVINLATKQEVRATWVFSPKFVAPVIFFLHNGVDFVVCYSNQIGLNKKAKNYYLLVINRNEHSCIKHLEKRHALEAI